MAKRRNWTTEEQAVVCRAYFWMLAMEQANQAYSKAQKARATLPLLDKRTKGSYEAKLMNISAVMVSLGLPTIQGYKPLGHCQKSLADMVKAMLPEYLKKKAA